MINPKIDLVLYELKQLKDASSKAAVESAAKRAEKIICELELEVIRSKGRNGKQQPGISEAV